jgi:hypothetical protein
MHYRKARAKRRPEKRNDMKWGMMWNNPEKPKEVKESMPGDHSQRPAPFL